MPAAVTGASGQQFFGGSLAPAGSDSASGAFAGAGVDDRGGVAGDEAPGAASGDRAGGAPGATAARPSEQSAAGGLWSGFGSADTPSLLPSDEAAAPNPSATPLTIGAALLGLGLMTLFAGLAVVEVRRRRRVRAADRSGLH